MGLSSKIQPFQHGMYKPLFKKNAIQYWDMAKLSGLVAIALKLLSRVWFLVAHFS